MGTSVPIGICAPIAINRVIETRRSDGNGMNYSLMLWSTTDCLWALGARLRVKFTNRLVPTNNLGSPSTVSSLGS